MQITEKAADETLRLRELAKIDAHRAEIAAICRRYGVAKLALFGSLTREGDFHGDSDFDFLVQFLPDVQHGFSYFAMEEELENLLGRKVELLTLNWLSEHFRNDVAAEAHTIYGES